MLYLRILLVFLLSLNILADTDFYKEEATQRSLFTNISWIKLLHYRKGLINHFKSEADGDKFFISANGKYDPKAELLALIDAIFKTDNLTNDLHAICRYPARVKWLIDELKIDQTKLPTPLCEKYEKFIKQVNAKAASLVFSSYYLNNPASVFGHTFLRLNRTKHGDSKNELLDTGINFGAATNGANPLYYVVGGFLGTFPGSFLAIPYYYKVREYNNYESRDLWSYNLNLTDQQLAKLVDHIWEVGDTYFDYYFLDENCSYHVLNLIDAIDPNFNFIEELPFKGYIYTIPIDTIYALYTKDNFVHSADYRASSSTVFYTHFEQLSKKERELFYQIIAMDADLTVLASVSDEERVAILDSAINYIDYKFAEEILKDDPVKTKWKKKYLVERSKIDLQSKAKIANVSYEEHPENGHPSRKVSMGIGHDNRFGTFASFYYRFSLHDLDDPQIGFSPYMSLKMGEANFEYYEKLNKLKMKNVTLYELTSLPPLTETRKNLSWSMSIGQKMVKDKNSISPYSSYGVEGGVGGTLKYTRDFTFFGLMMVDLSGTKKIQNNHYLRVGSGPR